MEHAYAKFLAGVETVTVAVSAPLLHFLERVRVAGGRKGKVLVEVELGAVGGGGLSVRKYTACQKRREKC